MPTRRATIGITRTPAAIANCMAEPIGGNRTMARHSCRRSIDTSTAKRSRRLRAHANYHPAIMWFDTPGKIPPGTTGILEARPEAAADMVINGRLLRNFGDYDSTTDRPAEFVPHEGDWEGIPTTNESYGWNPNDHSQKPPSHFIQLLAKAAATGGNLLLNVGPRGDGDDRSCRCRNPRRHRKMDARQRRFESKGRDRTPLAVQAWGESTRKGSTLYLHVFDWPKDGKLIVGGLKSNASGGF